MSVSDLQFIVSLHCQYLYVVVLYERSSAAPIFVTILAGTHWVTITTVLTSNQHHEVTVVSGNSASGSLQYVQSSALLLSSL